ncbi:MAG TPA: HNH endonuclease [Solirubrobacteraceae bacterium]|jgi:5-methylcytosine-specific restriction endonuclease McrA
MHATEPDLDRDARLIECAAKLFIEGRRVEALEALGQVDTASMPKRVSPSVGARGKSVPKATRVRPLSPRKAKELSLGVFRADRWTCCYCGRLLVSPRVLELVARLAGPAFPLKPGWNMKRDPAINHPAIERLYPNLEHVNPRSGGGTHEEDNLRASCTPCNEQKNARIGYEPLPVAAGWDGLEGLVAAMLERCERDELMLP